jgi:hypothetical protein
MYARYIDYGSLQYVGCTKNGRGVLLVLWFCGGGVLYFVSGGFMWVGMRSCDLDVVDLIGSVVHPGLSERREVFRERFKLYPLGCMVLVSGGLVVGYGVAHPWVLGSAPPLDSFLGGLPGSASCLYLHDVAILPGFRGGRSRGYLESMRGLGFGALAMVAVYGTEVLWGRYGFVPESWVDVGSYGRATYMWRTNSVGFGLDRGGSGSCV